MGKEVLDVNEPRTLKEWRELRGMSIDEVAGKTGFPPEQIRRWEEVGFDAHPYTKKGDELLNEALGELYLVLGVEEEGMSGPDYAPSAPRPGSFVVEPNPEVLEVEFIQRNAEALDLRLAVPTEWGTILKPLGDVSGEEFQAVQDYFRAEAEHQTAQRHRYGAYGRLIEEQRAHAGEDNLTVGDALERADQKLDEELKRLGGGSLSPQEDVTEEYEEEAIPVPMFYPDFSDPDTMRRWDESQEAWAWKAQTDFREKCLIEAAGRMYGLAKSWGALPGLLAMGGWGDAEDMEDLVEEHREEIESQVRRREE